MTSEEPLPDRCGAECRAGGYCENYPVEGATRCRMHGGAADNAGQNNGNYKHGAYSEHLRSDLSDREQDALDNAAAALADDEAALALIREQAVEALLRYKRSGDTRFLREARQLLSEFNIVDATDQREVVLEGELGHAVDHDLDESARAQLDALTGAASTDADPTIDQAAEDPDQHATSTDE